MEEKPTYEALEEKIKALEKELNDIKAGSSNQNRNRIIGSLAHEFNNILMGIQGNLSLVFLDTDKSDIIYDKLKDIEKNIKNGVKLTEQLFDFISGKTVQKSPPEKKPQTHIRQEDYFRIKKEIKHYETPGTIRPLSALETHPGYQMYEKINKGSATVLLIDDDFMILDIGKKMLEKIGLEVLTASDGYKALDIYTKDHKSIDVVIIDMIMPEISGIDLYYKLKKINPDIKTLIASGYRKSRDIDKILSKGNSRFIQKPFNMEHLTYEIGEILKYKDLYSDSAYTP